MHDEHRANKARARDDVRPTGRLTGEAQLKAQSGAAKSVWFGLGMSGLIGWSVTVPTLVGAALGIWVDRRYPSAYSWTLMLLLIGLVVGCCNAWHWVDSQYQEMQEDLDE